MKKSIIIALAAVVALASCTKVKTDSEKSEAITFKVINYLQQTKANTAYTGDAFGTFAYWDATDWATNGDANVFMDNEKIAQDPTYAAAGEWGPATQYFWPKTGKLTFASYSPYTAGSDNGFSEKPVFAKTSGFVFKNYTIVDDTDVDLMVADLATDQTKNNPEYQLSGNTDGVPTLFHHVLSQVGFLFKTVANPNPNVEYSKIILKEVKINDINNKGTYTQNNTNVWAGQTGTASYNYNPATGNNVELIPGEDAKAPKVESRIVLPQTLTAAGQQVELSYTIVTKYKSNDTPAEEEVTSTADLVTSAIASWDPNMSIVYTITINPLSDEPILFDPAVAPWDNVTDGTINIYRD
ncbi:MAG: fimbrillin family protein [Bacteroidales bacterium]|nr:fimbrillin family protein [Bacteroidales bacterium]